MTLIISALVVVLGFFGLRVATVLAQAVKIQRDRSEEHTSELQSDVCSSDLSRWILTA